MLQIGIARTDLTPYWGVELTGWGYYIERRWRTVRDPLAATAVVFDDGTRQVAVITLDLMVIDEAFTARTRALIAEQTGLTADAILLTCSHSHNAPAAGGLLGVGVCDPFYEQWAARQAATAAVLAWRAREPATMVAGQTALTGLTYNRTRPQGLIDPTLTAARIDREDGSPLAILVNFGGHPTVMTELHPWAVSRDLPGEVCDRLEAAYPGAIAMYLQAACGDVNFYKDFATPERCLEPVQRVVEATEVALRFASPVASLEPDSPETTTAESLAVMGRTPPSVAAASLVAMLPTRRWTLDEIRQDREEAQRRLAEDDVTLWREGFGRSMTNRPDDMVKRHGGDELAAVRAMCRFHIEWTDRMLPDYETRPEVLATEVQAIRVGGLIIVANASEFFSPLALDVRHRCRNPLMIACYANGRIGYLPDRYDIEARSYAGFQSPKYCDQFPFTPESGPAMCDAMIDAIARCQSGK